eukprot:CAMPEP_0179217828 /NCGR_PEP_ID=MMETSP0797-20121207/4127_1 /TAXON_ID=47934 /ORGANISM="Dinophysis acuminata, Strain DAEP01" /LENGTH=34 /DNA_ID= /DNA_START= /DNA_END= /DNA_ORIENTATION=
MSRSLVARQTSTTDAAAEQAARVRAQATTVIVAT